MSDSQHTLTRQDHLLVRAGFIDLMVATRETGLSQQQIHRIAAAWDKIKLPGDVQLSFRGKRERGNILVPIGESAVMPSH